MIESVDRSGNWASIPILGLALALLIVLVSSLGYIEIPLPDVFKIILAGLGGGNPPAGLDDVFTRIVLEVRLPRIVTSAAVGAGLAVSGVIFQSILLNPLADPYTLGISAGAAFGASVALVFGLTAWWSPHSVPLLAFIGAMATLAAVIWLASSGDERFSPTNLILSGVIVAAILSAGIGFLKYVADEQVAVIIFWLMGSFVSKTWLDAGLSVSALALGLAAAVFYARDLNLLSLGERTAESLGVETGRVRLVLLTAASLMTAVCVSVSGIIGFVGLIIPHLMRYLIGPDNRRLVPAAAAAGAILLVGADTVTRVFLPHEVPIGVLTALIGGPYFCYIFRRRLGRVDG